MFRNILNGINDIFIIFLIIFFIINIVVVVIFIIVWLKINIYKENPNINPKNMNNLMFPSVNLYIQKIILKAVEIQNIMSSILVNKFVVLNNFLKILKKSNSNPIKMPFDVKIKNKYA